MTLTVESMIASFEHPHISKIPGIPNYESLTNLLGHLNANAASVPCLLGNGQLGWLPIIISPGLYNTLSPIQFIVPTHPGLQPNIANFASAAQVRAANAAFNERKRLYEEHAIINRALKQQIIDALDLKYIAALKNRITGFANTSASDLINHLKRNYMKIQPSQIADNDALIKKAWDVNEPFEVLITQIEDAMAFADAAQTPYTAAQILSIDTGLFSIPLREWRNKPLPNRTWPNFKTHFTAATIDYMEENQINRQAGYHANSMNGINTAEALANLAEATATD
jgi:hypothetical protein